jgi:hypothetical protein
MLDVDGGVKVPWHKFWSPPVVYSVPESPPGHCYIPLVQSCCSAKYDPRLNFYPFLQETISSPAFHSVITSANFVIKSPYFKFQFIRYFLLGIAINCLIRFSLACASGDVVSIVIYLIILCLSPFLCRLGAKQYVERMFKYRKVMQKAMDTQSKAVLTASGMVVDVGERCLWLDFHAGVYEPPQLPPANAPVYFMPGAQVNL